MRVGFMPLAVSSSVTSRPNLASPSRMVQQLREAFPESCPYRYTILVRHPSDKRSDLGINFRPAQVLWPRAQAPEQTKASPMPGDNGFRFDDDQDVNPCRPKPTEENPKYSILGS